MNKAASPNKAVGHIALAHHRLGGGLLLYYCIVLLLHLFYCLNTIRSIDACLQAASAFLFRAEWQQPNLLQTVGRC